MPRTITINGVKLDEVRMPMQPANNTPVFLSYPISQICFSRHNHGLSLSVPAYLAVELYRIGILPQDPVLPVEISIDRRAPRWYTVSDVHYPNRTDSPFEEVTFTLTHVLGGDATGAADAPAQSQSSAVQGTFLADITHFLDETGAVARMPAAARKMASFLTLLIEVATSAPPAQDHDARIRCRTKDCKGTIRTSLPPTRDEITWYCPACGHNGVIRNWHATKWNQLERAALSE